MSRNSKKQNNLMRKTSNSAPLGGMASFVSNLCCQESEQLLAGITVHDIEKPQLRMVWPQQLISQPPEVEIPGGYEIRNYKPGDEQRFYEVMRLAGWPGWDAKRLDYYLPYHSQRMVHGSGGTV